jgi:iron(III) transport system permease protein
VTTTRIALAAAVAALAALLLLPWHQGAASAPFVAIAAAQPWLWPGVAALVAASAIALLRPREGRGLVLAAGGALALLLLQGLAVGLPATTWGIARDIFGPEARQAAFGPGAAVALAAATVLLGVGFARAGGFRGDGAVSLIAVCGAVALALFVFLPILRVMLDAFVEDGRFSLGVALARLAAPEAWSLACLAGGSGCGVVWNTLLLATLTGLLSTLLGLSLAMLETRGGLRRTGAFRAMAVLPLITPPFVVSLSLIVLFGRTGIVTTLLWEVFDIPRTRWIYGLPGVLLAQCLSQAPIAFLLLSSALRAIAPSLEEAAGTMGARPSTVFATVTMPLLRPAIANAVLLGFVESLGDFGNPLVLGGEFEVLATRIFFAIAGARHEPGRAAALALLLLCLTLAAFWLQERWVGKRQYVTVSGKGDAGLPALLPPSLRRVAGAVAYPWAAFTGIVYLIILFGAFVRDIGRFDLTLTWRHFGEGFAIERTAFGLLFRGAAWDSLFTTLQVAAISAPITALVGILLAWLFARTDFRGKSTLSFLTLLTFAIPGTVVGVAYITAFNVPPLEITGTGLILVICFVFRNMPVGVRGGLAALAQIDRSLDEASATMGADAGTTLRRVVLPLLRPALVAALAYAFVQAMTAVSAVIFLVSARHNMATAYIVGRVEAGEISLAIAYSAVLILIMLAVIMTIDRLIGRAKLGRRSAAPLVRVGA